MGENNYSDDPFKEAEDQLGIKLQSSIKKIFLANGFDNTKVIASINDEDIRNTEEFAKNTLADILEENQYEECFGIFKNNIPKFKFLDGHKKQLYIIIDYYKNSCKNKNEKIDKTPMKLNKNPDKNDMHMDMEVLNTNLPEEKKVIERNIIEWMKQKFNQTFNEELIKKIIITISLGNNNESDINVENKSNNVCAIIKCFCGIQARVLKKVTSGHRKHIWILSNFYRHLLSHTEFTQDTQKNEQNIKKKNTTKYS